MTTGTQQDGTHDPDQHQDADPARKDGRVAALADSYARDVNAEDGCLFFQFARSLTGDGEFVCIEGFADAGAAPRTSGSPT